MSIKELPTGEWLVDCHPEGRVGLPHAARSARFNPYLI